MIDTSLMTLRERRRLAEAAVAYIVSRGLCQCFGCTLRYCDFNRELHKDIMTAYQMKYDRPVTCNVHDERKAVAVPPRV